VLEGFAEIFPTIGGTTEAKRYVLQVGENVGDTLRVELSALNASALGLDGFDLQGLGALNIMHMDEALEFVNRQRANAGGSIARLESISTTLAARSENLSASRSRIRDADYAAETAELTKTMILQQSATSIIAQANATPQLALALLR
jgi:flagellin